MKKINDFPDLNSNLTHNISLDHFQRGLDINAVIDNHDLWIITASQSESISLENPHILHLFLDAKRYQEGVLEFVQKSLISLKDKVEQEHIDKLAFHCISEMDNLKLLEALRDNGMLNIKDEMAGYNMLAFTKTKSKIDWLVSNGCDINHKMSNSEYSDYGKTVYEMALESKKKGWIDYLKPYLSQDVVEADSKAKLEAFRQEKKPGKKLKLYLSALKEKNYSIVDDIINHPDTYQALIALEDGIGKNLIRYAVGHNSNDVLEKIIKLDYYQQHKDSLNKHNQCYTTDAVELGKNVSAKILYLDGFKNDISLRKTYETRYPGNSDILNLMIDDGYKPDLYVRFHNFSYHKLEPLNKEQIQSFFKQKSYILQLKITVSNSNFYAASSKSEYITVKDGSFKLISLVLAQQEKIDPDNFEQNLQKIVGSLGQHSKELALRFGSIILENFPDKDLLDYLGYYKKSDWLVEMNHAKLNAALEKIEYEDKPVRKMKI